MLQLSPIVVWDTLFISFTCRSACFDLCLSISCSCHSFFIPVASFFSLVGPPHSELHYSPSHVGSHFNIFFLWGYSTFFILQLVNYRSRLSYRSLLKQNLINVALPYHGRFAFDESWQVNYQKLLKIPGLKSFRATVPNWSVLLWVFFQ